MTFINGSQRFQKSIFSLLGLAAVAFPGRAFQMAAELPSAAAGAVSYGVLHGVTKGPSGQSVLGVQVTVQNVDEPLKRTVLSGRGGNFLIADLKPGRYRLSAQAEGIGAAAPATVEIAQNQVTYANVQLAADDGPAQPADSSVPDAALKTRTPAVTETSVVAELAAMKARIEFLEAELQKQSGRQEAPRGPLVAAAKPTPEAGPAPVPQQSAAAPAAAAPPAPTIPDALQAPESTPGVDNFTPFAYGDFTWLNGTPRNKDTVLDTKFFTPEVRFDTNYMEDFNQPIDHTIVGATEVVPVGRSPGRADQRRRRFPLAERARPSPVHGWPVRHHHAAQRRQLGDGLERKYRRSRPVGPADAYKYVSEAYGGYHFNVQHGLNVDAGIFVSYIGLFSYYNFDNWTYQPSYVSSNTPWFFNGVRVQWFPTNKLKIEPWFINGWQSYAKYNGHPGLGGQLLWEPKEWFKLVANQYGYGEDNLGLPKTQRIHTDDSIEVRYYSKPESLGLSKDGVLPHRRRGMPVRRRNYSATGGPSKASHRSWDGCSTTACGSTRTCTRLTLGGGEMSNAGRYLTLLPPIDGA